MATEIVVPQLGTEITEAEVTEWLVGVGDIIELDQPLMTLTTTKMSMDIESTVAGTLSEIRVEEGELAPVGAVLAVISGD